ncbi:BgtE-10023 [Blumeria graminis f. sp. tritici]|uniref:BgtE-10023 n=2 Tax=Blumeria graminis f. sp. tritici TaxID=62690 RepID=A0A061HR36_BLUGR|nr:putative secreted effector protein [Blumeria graminis f. sp. tritici 96224]VCU39355.1 BgtE-10023 [Blumeria graminis f. sp. tritici]
MNCLAAVLLLTGRKSPITDRWVISGNFKGTSIYDVLTVHPNHGLPVPSSDSGIFMTQRKGDQPGTYLAAYCSSRLDNYQMYYSITKGTKSLMKTAHEGISEDVELERYCSHLITKLSQSQPDMCSVHISKIRDPKECTEMVLVSLAFQRKISLHGKLGLTSTLAYHHSPAVILDRRIEVKNVILNGEFFVLKRTEWREYALAWYQGHLHEFNKLIGTNSWYLTSKIGHELQNGKFISELILKNHPDIVSFQDQLLALPPSSDATSSACSGCSSNDLRFMSKHAPREKGPTVIVPRLAATTADGYLSGEIGSEKFEDIFDNYNPPTNAVMC